MRKEAIIACIIAFTILPIAAIGYIMLDQSEEPEQMSFNTPVEPALRAVVKPTSQTNMPAILSSYSDGARNFYLVDVGYVERTFICSIGMVPYNGMSPVTLTVSTTEQTSVTESLSNTVTDSFSSTVGGSLKSSLEIAVEASIDLLIVGAKASAKESLETMISTSISTSSTKSTQTSFTNIQSIASTVSSTTSIGGHGEPAGVYRMALYGVTDVYFLVITSLDNSTLLSLETAVCVRSTSVAPHLDYSPNGVFDVSPENGTFDFAGDWYKSLPIPSSGALPLVSNAEIVTTTFSAYLWCEGTNVGQVSFTVTGIKVRYGSSYYVYGNAWYEGVPGGVRFNNVDQIFLRSSNKQILIGGTMHWHGNSNDNNLSGVAGWDRTQGFGGTDIGYMPEDPNKDISANQNLRISITDICVLMETPAVVDGTIPEIVTTTLTTNVHCEGSDCGQMTFTVIGIKVEYNGSYYVMGNAFYSGNPGKSRFNDVDTIYFRNSDRNILFGGTMHWMGSQGDNNEAGVAGFDKTGGWNSTTIKYMPEDPGQDFAANEAIKISITGICVWISVADSDANLVPDIAETTMVTALHCESAFKGSATFSVIGIKVKYNDASYIYGSAFFVGNPGASRFNDVESFYLINTTNAVLLGGTLICNGTVNDNNESSIWGYHKAGSSQNNVQYMHEDPSKDFTANETTRISITGICVAIG